METIRRRIIHTSSERLPRILIVDDSELDARLLKLQLQQQCVPSEIEIAHTCEGAFRMIKEKIYDLVFVDLKFPGGMTGTELLQRVGNETERITFIAISGLSDEEPPMVEAMRAGAAAIFTKPFTARQLSGICGMMSTPTPSPIT